MEELWLQRRGDVLIAQLRCKRILDDILIIQMGEELLREVDEPGTKLILDFQAVEFMSSAMMGKVVQLSKRCKVNRCELRVCNISPGMLSTFDKRGLLNQVFTICNSVSDAMRDLA